MMLAILFLAACGFGTDRAEREDAHSDVEAGGHAEESTVSLSAEAVDLARIRTGTAAETGLGRVLDLPGRIALDPRNEAVVSAWISGQVDTIEVRAGDDVRRGQSLAVVQSPELGETTANYRAAQAKYAAADARLQRLQHLQADGVSSEAQVLEAEGTRIETSAALEAAEERLLILGLPLNGGLFVDGSRFPSKIPVASPISGTVLLVDARVGQRVFPEETLFHVGALDEVWLMLDVFERDLSSVQSGQPVSFSVDAWPLEVFTGSVSQVGNWVQPESRTVQVRVVVSNPDRRLKPNMFASAQVILSSTGGPSGIVLPEDSVQNRDGQDIVFVETGVGQYEAVPVVVAERSGRRVRLQSGVRAGQRVVIDGAFALKSELEKGELGGGHAH